MDDKKYNVHLILEGNEEECLFEIVKKYGVHDSIDLTYQNAGGFGNVAPFYQNEISSEDHDCNLCVYDVDYRQNESGSPYNHVQQELLLVLGEKEMVDRISFCTNPNVMQILVLVYGNIDEVKLMTGSKKDNTPIIHKCWDEIGRQKHDNRGAVVVNYYDAKEWQLKIIFDSFEYGKYTYDAIYNNCRFLSKNYLAYEPGSNMFDLLKALREGNIEYFEEITKIVGNCD